MIVADFRLIALTKELTETLRKNRTIDWSRRDSARANMRRLVKRLLKKYNYPPEEAQNALDTVLRQCEQWADNDNYDEEEYSAPASKIYPFSDLGCCLAAEP